MMMLLVRSVLLLSCVSASGQNLTHDAWKEDLDFLVRELPARHKNLYYKLKKEDFEAQAAKIAERLPKMTEAEIRVALVRLVSMAANGHTSIGAIGGTPWYPLEFYQFPDGYYAVRAAPEYREAIGARLVSFGGAPAANLRKKAAATDSHGDATHGEDPHARTVAIGVRTGIGNWSVPV